MADLGTIAMLAFRHLVVRRGQAAVLLFGYAIGAAVMMVLLSVGDAMLVQSRDVSLVGGGEVTVLPEGIDLEGLRTGSMGGLFFGIDRARFLERQQLGGGRMADVVAATSPVIEHELVYLARGGRLTPLRAGGDIPSAATAVGAGLEVIAGRWEDSPADVRFRTPSLQALYDELDRFHSPVADSTWAEWHYFNLAPRPDEWWYVTYILGGDWRAGTGGGQLLVTRHRPGRPAARFVTEVPQAAVRIDTAGADLALGSETVVQRDGRYRIRGRATGPTGTVRFDLTVTPSPSAYFPPLELRSDRFVSGYVVPGVRALASGSICEGAECRTFEGIPAYHDHNWGVWRETSWEWGQARGESMSLLYGGLLAPDSLSSPSAAPYLLAAVDSLGIRQVLRFARIEYAGSLPAEGCAGVVAPARFHLTAARDDDSLAVSVDVLRAQASPVGLGGRRRVFLQLRGAFRVSGRLLGQAVTDSGLGFFETFVEDTFQPTREAPR